MTDGNELKWTASGGELKPGDVVWGPAMRRHTWWDRLLWKLFRIEGKKPEGLQRYVVMDTVSSDPRTDEYSA